MKRLVVLIILVTGTAFQLQSQGIIDDQPKMLFSNERTVGLFLNSNGIGADFRFAEYINARNDKLYDISFDYVKDPKEYKTPIYYQYYTRHFIYGKENLFWELKAQFGRQKEMYQKYDFSSISVRFFYSGGVAIGFQKPIYYEITTYDPITFEPTSYQLLKYDPNIEYDGFGGTAPFTKGLDEIKLIPGLTAKAGLSFEYSEREPMVHALEAGIAVTAYMNRVKIMYQENESDYPRFFFKMYLGYRFGTLLDISDAAKAKSAKERRKERREAGGQPMLKLY